MLARTKRVREAEEVRTKIGAFTSRRDLDRIAQRTAWFDQDLDVVLGLSAGDLVEVSIIASSWAAYDDDPGKAPKRVVAYQLTTHPEWRSDYDGTRQLQAEVKPVQKRRGGGAATIMVRPYNRTTLLVNRDEGGAHHTGHWIHVAPGTPVIEAPIRAGSAQMDLWSRG